MGDERVSMADAKKRFSELIGQVAYGGKRLLITKRGKPMARLVPVDEVREHLCGARGWLEEDDPFFDTMEAIVEERSDHTPRAYRKS